MMKKLLAAAGLSLALVTLALPVPAAAAPTAPQQISEGSARQIALNHAGLSESDVSLIYAKLDWDDGRLVYDVEFYTPDYVEYDYEIEAYTGVILSVDYEAEYVAAGQAGVPAPSAAPSPQASTPTAIGIEQAKVIALNQAGLSASQVVFTKAKQDWDDGRLLYECEFIYNTMEYEYEIDAYTGTVLEMDIDSIYD